MLSTLLIGSLTTLTLAAPSRMPTDVPSSVTPPSSPPVAEAQALPITRPVVSVDGPTEVRVERTFVLRAVSTDVIPGTTFHWEFGDGATAVGPEATHAYVEPGRYDVTLRTEPPEGTSGERITARSTIVAARRTVSLFTTPLAPGQESLLRTEAAQVGTALHVISLVGRSALLQQENLEQLLSPELETATRDDLLIFAPPPDVALGALVSIAQGRERTSTGATIILLTDGTPEAAPRLARIVAELLHPPRILLAPSDSLSAIVRMRDASTIPSSLRAAGVPIVEVDGTTPGPPRWALISQLIDLLLRGGVPTQSVLLLLLLPVIIGVIVTLRQVIGFTTMGLAVPVMIAVSLVLIGTLPGLALTAGVMFAGIVVRAALRRVRLLYLGRVGLATTFVVALVALALVVFPDLPVFPIVVLALTTERTYGVLAERGLKATMLISLETVLVATAAAVVAGEWPYLQRALTAWPELVLVAIALQVIVGRYTGLRATELLRFRDLLNEAEYGEEE